MRFDRPFPRDKPIHKSQKLTSSSGAFVRKAARVTLGIAIPAFALAAGPAWFYTNYSELPGWITIHFDITRVPTTALPKPALGALLTTIVVLGAVACASVALKQRTSELTSRPRSIARSGGFFASVAASLMAGAVPIHRGLTDRQDATGPGWWILAVVAIGFATAAFSDWLASTIHHP